MRHSKMVKKNALDAEELGGSDCESGHKKRLSKYSLMKKHQESVYSFILANHPDLSKEADSISSCSNFLVFRHFYTADKYKMIGGCTCKKHLLCSLCACRRAAATVRSVEEKVSFCLRENPELIPLLITITIKNGSDLSDRYDHISDARKRLIKSRRNSFRSSQKNKSVMRHIAGSFGSYEFKKGSGSGEWHPHTHEIALLKPGSFSFTDIERKGKLVSVPLDFERQLSQEWFKLTGDSFVLDVRRIDCSVPESSSDGQISGLLEAICETSKYALKVSDLDHSDQIHAYRVLSGRRLTFTYGLLWGLTIPDDFSDSIEDDLSLLPYIDLIYNYFSGSSQYILSEVTDTKDTFFNIHKKKVSSNRLSHLVESKYSQAVREYVEAL